MLEVTGFIRDAYPNQKHAKLLSNASYIEGFYFKVFVDYDDISDVAMPIKTSSSIIINAVNKKYYTDFSKNDTFTFLDKISIKKALKEFTELTDIVQDEIFNYQLTEANEVYNQQYYLAAGCTYGVAIERLLWLLIEKNSLDEHVDNTQVMFMVNKLIKSKIIDKTDENRLKNVARFRNQTAHTNSFSLKMDCDVLRASLDYIVKKYF